jgi:chitodextrinase
MIENARAPRAARRILLTAAVLAALPAAGWARDRTPPSQPRNLRVVSVTAYSATLTWTPSTDNSGQLSYVFCCVDVNSMTAPGDVSTFVYTKGLSPSRTYSSLRMYAVDAAGNYSKPSNFVTFTTARDTQPPSGAVVSVTGVGPRHVSLLWSATDDDPNLRYFLSMNGTPLVSATRETATTIALLQPETTYTFAVQARDSGGQSSPPSAPSSVTTLAPNPDDVTPPTTPAGFRSNSWGDCEVELNWAESTDDLDPAFQLEYQVFVNGVYDHSTSLRYVRTIVYGTLNGSNTFGLVAVDTAGNRSEMAEVTEELAGCFP